MPSDTGTTTLPPLRHIGIVVKDIDKTTQFLSSIWGIGPWQPQEISIGKDNVTTGEPLGQNKVQANKDNIIVGEPCRLKEAHAKLGPIVLELIQPIEGKSVWSEFLKAHGEGLHHIAFSVSNWKEMASKLQEHGDRIVAGAIQGGKRWCYFGTKPGGIIIEIAEPGIHDEQVKDLD